MNIIFKEVEIFGFMSFEDAQLKLDDNGYVIVTGQNQCVTDNAISNGSGKSSIWEAIVWAITGDTIRGAKDIVNHALDKGTYVKLTMSVDNVEYKLLRAKNHKEHKTNLIIERDGEDVSGKGIRDSEKILKDMLPDLTSSLLGSVIVLGQGLPERFSNNTPSGRKEILEKLSKSDFMIEDLKQRVSTRTSYLNSEKQELDRLASEERGRYTTKQEILESDKTALDNFVEVDYTDQIKYAEEQILAITKNIDTHNSNISLYAEEYDKVSAETTQVTAEQREKITEVETDLRGDELDFVAEESEYKSQISQLQKQIREIDNVIDVCPTCGQGLPDVHKLDSTELKQQLEQVESVLSSRRTAFQDVKAKAQEAIEVIKEGYKDTLANLAVQSRKFTEDKSNENALLLTATKDLEKQKAQKNELELKAANQSTQREAIATRIQMTEFEIKELEEALAAKQADIEALDKSLAVLSTFETALRRNFRGFLLGHVIEYINTKSKQYCNTIFGNDKIFFGLDGNNISIMFDDKEIESLSGGERQKVDLIIQFSLRDMLCNHLGFSTNILVLDEIFDNLDAKGCDQIIEMISTSLSDVSSIFLVTHRKDLAIPYDSQIEVVKDANNISHLTMK